MKDVVVGTCLGPNGSPSGSQNRPRRSLEHILGVPGELLGSFGRPFFVENVRRRPSCPGSDVLGLKNDAHKFPDWKTWIGRKK